MGHPGWTLTKRNAPARCLLPPQGLQVWVAGSGVGLTLPGKGWSCGQCWSFGPMEVVEGMNQG